MRLSLKVRAWKLFVSEADEVLLAVTGALWRQLSFRAVQFALSALGVLKRDILALLAGVPSSEQHFFRGLFAAILQRELDSRKQVAEIAKQLRPLQAEGEGSLSA